MTAVRHLDYGANASIVDVGAAGIQAILDGGELDVWRPILCHIQDHPWGAVAARVEQVLDHLESYGTAAALRAWLRRCRGGMESNTFTLARCRSDQGLSQEQLGALMGVSQAQIARLEASRNPTMGSVERYLRALAMRPVGVLAVTADGQAVLVRLAATDNG